MADFFAVRDAIKARIEEKIPEIRKVFFSEDIESLKQASQLAPAVHIVYAGYSFAATQSDRARDKIKIPQRWGVVLVYRNAKNDFQPGELLDKLVAILNGYKWGDSAQALELSAPTFSPSYLPGVAYYPLAFTTDVINTKEPD